MENYQKKTSREHILERPNMYIGASNETTQQEYIFRNDKIIKTDVTYVQGLLKIINEIIDNSVDVAIKTNFKGCNLIKVNISDTYVEVIDNGTGIPVKKNSEGEWIPYLCWGYAMSGSNFDDDENRKHIGMNGVGSYCTNVWSKKFTAISDDGENRYEITFKDNASSYVDTVKKSQSHGVYVKFYPDLERFGITEISEVYSEILYLRLINLSMSFPEIMFIFNGKKIKIKNFSEYIKYFSNDYECIDSETFKIGVMSSDDFEQISFVNGLNVKDGGSHIDYVTNSICEFLCDKINKKYKDLKKSDIKNRLKFIVFLKDFINPKFSSQTKEKLTNTIGEVSKHIDCDLEGLAKKILKNDNIINPIIDVFKIKEEFKRRQELKKIDKPKKIKDEKYYTATNTKKYLMICEGESALGSLMPAFGLSECGYYVLKGKPLNVWEVSQQKFTSNKELSTLYSIIKNEGYRYIVFATDEDLDGIHIRALLSGFIYKYLRLFEKNIYVLHTPIIAYFKNNKMIRWSYDLTDNVKKGETSFYFKGLGSWEKEDLHTVIKTDGLDKMIIPIIFDDSKSLCEWLGSDSTPRKKYILNNNFSIAKT
jgi:DNA topoisomerase-2